MPLGQTFYDQELLYTNRLKITSNGDSNYKPAGFTMGWSTVTTTTDGASASGTAAVGGLVATTKVTLVDGQEIQIGEKFVRYGTILFLNTGTGLYEVATTATTLVPGQCFMMQYTITDQDPTSPNFGGLVDEGRVYKARILAGGTGQPTWAAVYAALPNVTYLS